jgi:hypothetical protein
MTTQKVQNHTPHYHHMFLLRQQPPIVPYSLLIVLSKLQSPDTDNAVK